MNFHHILVVAVLSASVTLAEEVRQSWSEQPGYQEVNPHGDLVLPCVINNMRGQCRWEKDGTPVGIYRGKYEWSGNPETGDCSLRIFDAQLQYDDGVWQCQVTPSSFLVRDALISEGAQVVIRGTQLGNKRFALSSFYFLLLASQSRRMKNDAKVNVGWICGSPHNCEGKSEQASDRYNSLHSLSGSYMPLSLYFFSRYSSANMRADMAHAVCIQYQPCG